jgi:hypothetical protein
VRSEMSERSLAELLRSVNKFDGMFTVPLIQDEQAGVRKGLTTTSSVKPILQCIKCKSIAAVVSNSLSKDALYGVATEEATSTDVCSSLCHILYTRMHAR